MPCTGIQELPTNPPGVEHEAIYYLREAVAQLERPALLFSGGKDSIVLAHLCYKAFQGLPCPLLHIDTGHNFPETLEFRDRFAQQMGAQLLIARVEESLQKGTVQEESGPRPGRNAAQSTTLKEAIARYRLDGLLGGGRRDEEKARAKERFFSHRDQHSQWKPKEQRPEFWSLVNAERHPGEHFRIFPLSNWTELDIWRYIQRHEIELPDLYFAHQREVIHSQGMLLAKGPWTQPLDQEPVSTQWVRFRTVGDMTCTGAVLSQAKSLDEIVQEVRTSPTSERGTRADDQRSQAAMEDRKKLGYF